jgi:8-oxo-dGTP diphosphatase
LSRPDWTGRRLSQNSARGAIRPSPNSEATEHTINILCPIENERQERLISVREVDEAGAATLPIRFSLVLAHSENGYLLVFNQHRRVWELPGGFVDPGETPRQCAARELQEESGQSVGHLRWRAALEFFGPTGGTSFGALYSGDVLTMTPFAANSEIDAMGFWPATALPEDTSSIDRALVVCFGEEHGA